jgi:hypothetical protein
MFASQARSIEVYATTERPHFEGGAGEIQVGVNLDGKVVISLLPTGHLNHWALVELEGDVADSLAMAILQREES